MRLFTAGMSETGPTRPRNEDSILIDNELNLCVLADGMGGHQGGALASSLTVKYLHEALSSISVSVNGEIDEILSNAIKDVNLRIFQTQAELPHNQRMGATLVVTWFLGDRLLLGNVGDSRCYRFRNGKLSQLTIDHTLWEKIRENEPTVTSDAKRAFRSTLTKVMGTQQKITPDIGMEKIRAGDRFLICSDGITNELNGLELSKIFTDTASAAETVKKIISEAASRQAKDNISAIVIDVEGTTPSTVRFSKSVGPIRKKFTSTFSIVSLMLLFFFAAYAWHYNHQERDLKSSALMALAEGNYPAAQDDFEKMLEVSGDIDFSKLFNRLGLVLSLWYQFGDPSEIYTLAVNALMDAEELKTDMSNMSIWPGKPPDGLLKVFRDAAKSRWERHHSKSIADEIEAISGDAGIRMKIRLEEARELYCTHLKTGKALKELSNISRELENDRR